MKKRIGVLMGGPSAEHEVSLASGVAMVEALRERSLADVAPIKISRNHAWFLHERPASIERALGDIDVALCAFHGEWGEDGRVQALLEWFRIPYAGSRVSASAVAMDKALSRILFRNHSLAVADAKIYRKPVREEGFSALRDTVLKEMDLPLVVKPVSRGSSIGVSIVRRPNFLMTALREALSLDERILAERYLAGTEVSCGVMETLAGELRALPVVQIIPPPQRDFFDFHAKYSGETMEIVPAEIPAGVVKKVQEAAMIAHGALGCRHYSRTDMIIVNEEPVILETNTLPGMTPQSIFPKAAATSGMPFPDLILHFVNLALRDRSA